MLAALLVAAALSQLPPPTMPGWQPPPDRSALPIEDAVNQEPVEAERVPDTTDAVAWAVQDILLRNQHDKPFLRYLWVPPWGSPVWHQTNSLLVNSAASKSSVIHLPETTAGGWLIVWDLRKLAPKAEDLERLIVVWDALSYREPYFHAELPKGQAVACRTFTFIDGKQYNARRFVPAPHVEQGYTLLENETLSFAPLVRADDFLRRLSSTVDGGLYYHFAGFIRGGRRLTETEIFKEVGIDVALSRTVEGDDRAAVFQSGVTAKPRMVEQVQGALGKARITYDIFDEDFDAGRHPIYHLLDMVNRARGKEIIYEKSNGLFGYVITDGAGTLADVAPDNLVSDHHVPDPVTKRLFPPLSCVRCHGPFGGIQQVRNDVPFLLKGGLAGDVDVFDDLSSNDGRQGTVDRLAGLFAAEDKFYTDLGTAKIRYADAVWSATRGMDVRERELVAVKAAEAWAGIYANYWYPTSLTTGNISADQAALELGHRVKTAGEGAAFFQQTFKPGRVDILIGGVPVTIVDPTIAAMRRGLSVRRQDFERVYAFAAYLINEARRAEK